MCPLFTWRITQGLGNLNDVLLPDKRVPCRLSIWIRPLRLRVRHYRHPNVSTPTCGAALCSSFKLLPIVRHQKLLASRHILHSSMLFSSWLSRNNCTLIMYKCLNDIPSFGSLDTFSFMRAEKEVFINTLDSLQMLDYPFSTCLPNW